MRRPSAHADRRATQAATDGPGLLPMALVVAAAVALSADRGRGSVNLVGSPGPAQVERAGTIPVREVSGLGLNRHGAQPQVLAIGDHDFDLAVGALHDDAVDSFDIVDLGKALRASGVKLQKTSQWEGVTSDASGRIFVLEENPGHVFVFDPKGSHLVASITLDVHTGDTALAELESAWDAEPNSRGEGLALLGGGHLLVLKEKHPSRLVEFGFRGDTSVGLAPLEATTPFPLPGQRALTMVPLRQWVFADEVATDFPDLSDLSVDDTRTYWVVSGDGRAIGQLRTGESDERVKVTGIAKLAEPGPDNPEGLAMLTGTRALVASDAGNKTSKPDTTLFLARWDGP